MAWDLGLCPTDTLFRKSEKKVTDVILTCTSHMIHLLTTLSNSLSVMLFRPFVAERDTMKSWVRRPQKVVYNLSLFVAVETFDKKKKVSIIRTTHPLTAGCGCESDPSYLPTVIRGFKSNPSHIPWLQVVGLNPTWVDFPLPHRTQESPEYVQCLIHIGMRVTTKLYSLSPLQKKPLINN